MPRATQQGGSFEIQTQAYQILKTVPLISLGIDGFLLMIEGPAGPLGKESPRPWGFGEHKWRKHCGRGAGVEDRAPKPPKGSEREQVRNGRRTEIQGMAGPLDRCPWMKGNGKGGQGEAFSLLERY